MHCPPHAGLCHTLGSCSCTRAGNHSTWGEGAQALWGQCSPSLLLASCYKKPGRMQMCCWGASVPLAPKTASTKAHPRPPGPLLPLSQQVYFTRSFITCPSVTACPHFGHVGSPMTSRFWHRMVRICPSERGTALLESRSGDMTKGFSLDLPLVLLLWLHPVSCHRGVRVTDNSGVASADANVACSGRGAAGPCAQPP